MPKKAVRASADAGKEHHEDAQPTSSEVPRSGCWMIRNMGNRTITRPTTIRETWVAGNSDKYQAAIIGTTSFISPKAETGSPGSASAGHQPTPTSTATNPARPAVQPGSPAPEYCRSSWANTNITTKATPNRIIGLNHGKARSAPLYNTNSPPPTSSNNRASKMDPGVTLTRCRAGPERPIPGCSTAFECHQPLRFQPAHHAALPQGIPPATHQTARGQPVPRHCCRHRHFDNDGNGDFRIVCVKPTNSALFRRRSRISSISYSSSSPRLNTWAVPVLPAIR